ncbi:MAG: hypothetical protein HC808_10750 [Candidatus Competibacteraceae bacterium]|nr:hypothetical protein [Candidatus Competibacteraceae bacterium]
MIVGGSAFDVVITDGGGPRTINYIQMESPITDDLDASARTFTYSGANDDITIADDATVGNGVSTISSVLVGGVLCLTFILTGLPGGLDQVLAVGQAEHDLSSRLGDADERHQQLADREQRVTTTELELAQRSETISAQESELAEQTRLLGTATVRT